MIGTGGLQPPIFHADKAALGEQYPARHILAIAILKGRPYQISPLLRKRGLDSKYVLVSVDIMDQNEQMNSQSIEQTGSLPRVQLAW